jgi:subtilisin family serine protease
MKEKYILRVFSLAVVTIFLFSAGHGLFVSADSESDITYKGYDSDEKIICNATLEDDFADNIVIVVLNKEATFSFRTYTLDDFVCVGCSKVKDLTESVSDLVKRQLDSKKVSATRKANSVNEETGFNRIISLELNEKSKENVIEVIKQLEERDDVICVEPSYNYHYDAVPNDPHYVHQWGLPKIQAPDAWNISKGSNNVRVGIMDSGIASHPDLNANVVAGWDFYNNNSITTDDAVGHGTFVAGIVGAVGNNGLGISGVCWNVKLVPLQVNDTRTNTPSPSAMINAISYATANDIPIINCSISGKGNDNALKIAISNYPGLFVCAAGNGYIDTNGNNIGEDTDVYPYYPASFQLNNLITVGATTSSDTRPIFSNYGKNTVDIFAPGVDIYGTTTGGYGDGGSGTSYAAPYVAGVAALLLTKNQYSPWGLKSIIMDNVDKVSGLSSLCVSGGRLNAYKALNYNLSFGGGSGTSSSPYLISTVQHLRDIDKLGYYDKYDGYTFIGAGKYFKLNADLTLSGNWTPISDMYRSMFCGTFDGNGKKINGLANNTSTAEYFGLFKYSCGTIKNLTMNSVNISKNVGSTNANVAVGAISGYNIGIIDNCTVNGSITVSGYNIAVGGLVGLNNNLIKNSTNNAAITSSTQTSNAICFNATGGIAGNSLQASTVSYCTNNGAVKGDDTTGGIVGYAEYTDISNCTTTNATANIVKLSWKYISKYNVAGGIAGETFFGTVENCAFKGTVQYTNAISSSTTLQPKMGQIIGYSYKTTLTSNTSTGTVDKGTLQFVGSYNQALYAVSNGLYGQQIV